MGLIGSPWTLCGSRASHLIICSVQSVDGQIATHFTSIDILKSVSCMMILVDALNLSLRPWLQNT